MTAYTFRSNDGTKVTVIASSEATARAEAMHKLHGKPLIIGSRSSEGGTGVRIDDPKGHGLNLIEEK